MLKKNGKSASLSDISEGDILRLTYNSNGKISGIEIMGGSMNAPQGGGMGAPGMQKKSSLELSAKYNINSGNMVITSKSISQTTAIAPQWLSQMELILK